MSKTTPRCFMCRCESLGKDYCLSSRHAGDPIDYEKERKIFLDRVVSEYKQYIANIDGWDTLKDRPGFIDKNSHLLRVFEAVNQVTEI